jgi:hypothetical protein
MKIEVLYVPTCANHAPAQERLREILSADSFQNHVNEGLVNDAAYMFFVLTRISI